MSKDARKKNRKAGEKIGHRREAGRTPSHKVRAKREAAQNV